MTHDPRGEADNSLMRALAELEWHEDEAAPPPIPFSSMGNEALLSAFQAALDREMDVLGGLASNETPSASIRAEILRRMKD